MRARVSHQTASARYSQRSFDCAAQSLRSAQDDGMAFVPRSSGCWRNTGSHSMSAMFGTDRPPVDESRRWRWRGRGRCTWGVAPGWNERTPLASGSRGNDRPSGIGLRRAAKGASSFQPGASPQETRIASASAESATHLPGHEAQLPRQWCVPKPQLRNEGDHVVTTRNMIRSVG